MRQEFVVFLRDRGGRNHHVAFFQESHDIPEFNIKVFVYVVSTLGRPPSTEGVYEPVVIWFDINYIIINGEFVAYWLRLRLSLSEFDFW